MQACKDAPRLASKKGSLIGYTCSQERSVEVSVKSPHNDKQTDLPADRLLSQAVAWVLLATPSSLVKNLLAYEREREKELCGPGLDEAQAVHFLMDLALQ